MIRTINLVKTYKMGEIEVPALRGVDLEINKGDFVAIEGPSGSGKSTLLNMIGCLDRPTSGTVFIDGVDISLLTDKELAEIRMDKIGFVFQQFNLIHTLNALENVGLPLFFAGVGREDEDEASKGIARQCGA
ncbi:MAG: ABC transporter ATP-binding protein [Methanocellales archaeon]|nr:ABC transporter ATP-binding protein [Methanocellales archaeon]